MTEGMLIGGLIYLLIGYMIADTFIVKVNAGYWLTLLFYPVMVMVFFVTLLFLMIALKIYALEERING